MRHVNFFVQKIEVIGQPIGADWDIDIFPFENLLPIGMGCLSHRPGHLNIIIWFGECRQIKLAHAEVGVGPDRDGFGTGLAQVFYPGGQFVAQFSGRLQRGLQRGQGACFFTIWRVAMIQVIAEAGGVTLKAVNFLTQGLKRPRLSTVIFSGLGGGQTGQFFFILTAIDEIFVGCSIRI